MTETKALAEEQVSLGESLFNALISASGEFTNERWANLDADTRGRFARAAQRFLRDQAAARLDAGVTREQGWRDISTAPKDGTPVLVWYPLGGFHGVVARFPKGGRYWQVTWDCDDLAPVSPTHWMPLPPLPHNPKEESR